jgi:group I intron endonuclease
MEPPKQLELSKQILDNPTERYCEIYKITNLINGKIYIGQAVSHILNHNRYRPYGREGRFRCHISEAFSTKKHQSHYLNNAIRKHGVTNFAVELIECCSTEEADSRETYFIGAFNSLYPYGYNLKYGGASVFTHSVESKKRLSNGVLNYFKDKKYERFRNITKIDDDIDKYIKPLRKHNKQYGWYVYIGKSKADFGGVHIPLDESRKSAFEFVQHLKNQIAT